jgi:hypothetical protein
MERRGGWNSNNDQNYDRGERKSSGFNKFKGGDSKIKY